MQKPIFNKKSSSTILTCLGAIGVVATAVMTAKATPEAVRRIRADSQKHHDKNPDAYTTWEAVQSAWVCYVPSALLGISTIACIVGANALNKRQQAAIVSAYTLVDSTYRQYRGKVKDFFGDEADLKIMDSIRKEPCEDVCISTYGLACSSSLDFDKDGPKDIRLFYDSFSKRYFESTVDKVLQAEYHLNRNFTFLGYIGLNDFYEFLGLEQTDFGSELGWSVASGEIYWIDFDHSKTIMDDGTECYIIDMVFEPTADCN